MAVQQYPPPQPSPAPQTDNGGCGCGKRSTERVIVASKPSR